jgi:hypothetical protein
MARTAHWIHGGDTNLDNCLLLCKRHHAGVPTTESWGFRREQLIKVEGRIVTIAPTTTFGLARGPD